MQLGLALRAENLTFMYFIYCHELLWSWIPKKTKSMAHTDVKQTGSAIKKRSVDSLL